MWSAVMKKELVVLGSLDGMKREVANNLIQSFKAKFPAVDGEMYLGYPIYHDEVSRRKVCVDIALISKIGVFIINILNAPVTDYGVIQDDIYAKVESKFKKQPFFSNARSSSSISRRSHIAKVTWMSKMTIS